VPSRRPNQDVVWHRPALVASMASRTWSRRKRHPGSGLVAALTCSVGGRRGSPCQRSFFPPWPASAALFHHVGEGSDWPSSCPVGRDRGHGRFRRDRASGNSWRVELVLACSEITDSFQARWKCPREHVAPLKQKVCKTHGDAQVFGHGPAQNHRLASSTVASGLRLSGPS